MSTGTLSFQVNQKYKVPLSVALSEFSSSTQPTSQTVRMHGSPGRAPDTWCPRQCSPAHSDSLRFRKRPVCLTDVCPLEQLFMSLQIALVWSSEQGKLKKKCGGCVCVCVFERHRPEEKKRNQVFYNEVQGWGKGKNELVEGTEKCLIYLPSVTSHNTQTKRGEIGPISWKKKKENETNPPQTDLKKTKPGGKRDYGLTKLEWSGCTLCMYIVLLNTLSKSLTTMHSLSSCQLTSASQGWLHSPAAFLSR